MINVWDEAWLPGDSSSKVPTPYLNSPSELRVCDLIEEQHCRWNEEVLQEHFNEEDTKLIREIPLSNRRPHDTLYWWPTPNGVYSTKSGYWLGRLGHIQGWSQQYAGIGEAVWKEIWKLGGPPKLIHFIWKACTNSLATQGRLRERHVTDDAMCLLCGDANESIIHTLIECPEVQQVWMSSPFADVVQAAPKSSFMDVFA